MVLDRQAEAERQSVSLRKMLASRGASLHAVLPEFFGPLPPVEDVSFEELADDPVEVEFDQSMTLEEAMQVMKQISLSSSDLPSGEVGTDEVTDD